MRRPTRTPATLALAALVAAGIGFAAPHKAAAETYEELQRRVEETTGAYDEALARVAQVQEDIDANEAEVARIEEELPAQRAKAAASVRTLYKMQQSEGGLVDLVLSAEDFNDLVATIAYLDRIQARNTAQIEALAQMSAELQQAKDTLAAREAQALQEADAAREAQASALAAREEVRRQAVAQAAAEAAEAQAALEAAAAKAAEGATFTTASGEEATVSTPETDTTPAESVVDDKDDEKPAESEDDGKEDAQPSDTQEEAEPEQEVEPQKEEPVTSERDAFVAKWAGRIDAYLAGSPLGGHGATFAEAAWDYNVDPRWSPAISCIESSKGAVCFMPHNAWGWGSASWGDWDSAIRDHVAGLSAGYGYTISTGAAQKYCPPNWQFWYSSVLSEMNSI